MYVCWSVTQSGKSSFNNLDFFFWGGGHKQDGLSFIQLIQAQNGPYNLINHTFSKNPLIW